MSTAQKLAHNQKRIKYFASERKKVPRILYYRDIMFRLVQAVLCLKQHEFFSGPLFRRDTGEPEHV